jgi:hypothetical protein
MLSHIYRGAIGRQKLTVNRKIWKNQIGQQILPLGRLAPGGENAINADLPCEVKCSSLAMYSFVSDHRVCSSLAHLPHSMTAFAAPLPIIARTVARPKRALCAARADVVANLEPDQPVSPVKRGRGRPKGSKNKRTASPEPETFTATDSTRVKPVQPSKPNKTSQNGKPAWPARNTSKTRRSQTPFQAVGTVRNFKDRDDDRVNVNVLRKNSRADMPGLKELLVTAKDGMRDGEQAHDFLQAVLPLVSKREVAASAETDEDARRRALLSTLRNVHASGFRWPGKYKSLLPISRRDAARSTCDRCDGDGMAPCEFCSGDGFVDIALTGPPGTLVKFAGGEAVVSHLCDMEDSVLCPFCGGMCRERCVECLGFGKVAEPGASDEGAAGDDVGEQAWGWADRDTFLAEHANRIVDVGVDGTTILRRKRARRKKESAASAVDETPIAETDTTIGPVKMQRGRPRKGQTMEELYPMTVTTQVASNQFEGMVAGSPALAKSSRGVERISRGKMSRSTDFINTTDFQVGSWLSGKGQQSSEARSVTSTSPSPPESTSPLPVKPKKKRKSKSKDAANLNC